MNKIAICGAHGTGKTKICESIKKTLYTNFFEKEKQKITQHSSYGPTEIYYGFENKFTLISEQFREVVNLMQNFTQQTEDVTFTTYYKQKYLENLHKSQNKKILCDRSVVDTFIYNIYFNKAKCNFDDNNFLRLDYCKIYLIEPSDREIENDGFRMIDKKEQLEIHGMFIRAFDVLKNAKDIEINLEIINQDEANKDYFISKVASEFDL